MPCSSSTDLVHEKPPKDWAAAQQARGWTTVDELGKGAPAHLQAGATTVIKPQYVVEKIYELTKGEAIITTEVGQNQMWAAQFYKFNKPRQLITSGGLGTMGYGFPAAIGAQVASPDATVIDIAGDGSIQMNIQELATAVQNKLPVKVAILNNGFLGMVRQWQELFYEKRYSATAHGGPGLRQAGRGLRGGGPEGHQARGSGAGDQGGPGYPQAGDHGLPGGPEECVIPWCPRAKPCTRCCWSRRGEMEPRHTISVLVDNNPGCSPGSPACFPAGASTSRACAWPRPWTRRSPASPW